MAIKSDVPADIRGIPSLREFELGPYPGCVYFLARGGEVVYVGQTGAPLLRIPEHMRDKDFTNAYFVAVREGERLDVEAAFIRLLKPVYNIRSDGRFGSVRSKDAGILARYGCRVAAAEVDRPVPRLITAEQASEMMGVSEDVLEGWREERAVLFFIRLPSGGIRYREKDVQLMRRNIELCRKLR